MSGAIHGIESFGHGVADTVGTIWNDITGSNDPKNTPQVKAPQTQVASQPLASTTALQTQLAHEQNARSTASILTSPGGLTDEPTTTSSLLTGV